MEKLNASSTLLDVERLFMSVHPTSHSINMEKEWTKEMLQFCDIPYCKELGTVIRAVISCKTGIPREVKPITIQEAMENVALTGYID